MNKFLSTTKNKLIILDNAGCHRSKIIKNLIGLNNNLLYTIPYNSRTQAIESFFNILKSRLKQKNSDLSYNNLCLNVQNVISEIPKFFYLNLIEGTYKNNF